MLRTSSILKRAKPNITRYGEYGQVIPPATKKDNLIIFGLGGAILGGLGMYNYFI